MPHATTGDRVRTWVRHATHAARALLGRRAVVLLYHRVADDASDPYGLCVAPRDFEEHLQVMRETGQPMRLADFTRALHARSLPKRAICVTFDDGYADNAETAQPLLAKHDVPALVFVTTGPGGREREFWWDELERVFLQPGELPDSLQIEISGRRHECSLTGARRYTGAEQQQYRGWHLLDQRAPTARHAALKQVYDLVLPLGIEERARALDAVLAWAGQDATAVRPPRRALQPPEVTMLAAGGIVDVGAHTVNHPALPSQTRHTQRAEIAESKRQLEAWTGRAVDGFAYPYGFHDDAVVSATREAGFAFACAGDFRAVTRRTDPFLLPRIEAPAADGDALGRLLRWQLQ